MQGDLVAFGVEDDGLKTVGADGVFFLHEFAALGLGGLDGGVEPSADIEVNQRAVLGWFVFAAHTEAGRDAVARVRQEAEFATMGGFLGHVGREHSGLKFDGAVEFEHRDVQPDEDVFHGN